LKQQQEGPLQQEELTHEQTPKKVQIPNKKHSKRRNNFEEKRPRLNMMLRLGIYLLLQSKVIITI
jgi:hypothetical protein